ncbi:hypothetical protein EV356DRAFT_512493 [Viridothelium virens]|uniref:Mediator of RNA polymerase II transcription subunit 17 n=1 Tax=Viridothelium virens TaxID=1048519 RepID=A0A6A6HFB1_VIRVR|nr:hypothetical protein EV356DRAFT_512493 [Viridothelium virens]
MAQSQPESPSFSLSLRPWPSLETEDSLNSTISRIFESRGHFKDIIEQKLVNEIELEQDSNLESVLGLGQPNENEDELDPKTRREKLYIAKTEMWQGLHQAQQEVLMVQDLVSLLLRKESDLPLPPANPMPPGPTKAKTKKGAEKSMTDYVLDNTPVKSMGLKESSSAAEVPAKLETRREEEEKVSQGHRMKSLNKSVDSLLDAATRLNREVEKETKYWEQILTIREDGWSLTKFPRERHNLAVSFGFSEARGEYKARGTAALQIGETGNIVLDEALTANTKTIRVRVLENCQVMGSSYVPQNGVRADFLTAELVQRARDSLFDEELFQELTRESRLLLPYNVTMDENKIRIRYPGPDTGSQNSGVPAREILIDLVGKDEMSTIGDRTEDLECQGIALALRVLLSYAHKQRLHHRSRIPHPISEGQSAELRPVILRIFIGYLQQKVTLDAIRSDLDQRVLLFGQGGLKFNYTLRNISPDLSSWLSKQKHTVVATAKPQASTSFADFVNALSVPLETRVALTMEHSTSSFNTELAEVLLRTHLSPPLFGTQFALEILDPKLKPAETLETESYDSLEDLTSALNSILSSHLLQSSALSKNGWKTVMGRNIATKGDSKSQSKRKRIERRDSRALDVKCGRRVRIQTL